MYGGVGIVFFGIFQFRENVIRAPPPEESALATIDSVFVEGIIAEGALVDTPPAGEGYVAFLEVGKLVVEDFFIR